MTLASRAAVPAPGPTSTPTRAAAAAGPGGRAAVSSLNIGVHYRHSDMANQNPFPALGGSNTVSAWDVPVNYSFTRASLFHVVRLQFNRNNARTQNRYAFSHDIAGDIGIRGAAADPFDWLRAWASSWREASY